MVQWDEAKFLLEHLECRVVGPIFKLNVDKIALNIKSHLFYSTFHVILK